MIDQAVTIPLAGYYLLEAVKPDGSRRVLANWFENLILDAGLNRMGTGTYFDYAQVGTGSTAPANSDTALVARVAGTNAVNAQSVGAASSSPYYGYSRKTFRFTAGSATGNLTEVGIGWAASGSLFSRALIKDGFGTPTTITVLSDEVLDVTYELRCYAPLSDSTPSVVNISGTNYTFVVRSAYATSVEAWAPENQAVGHASDSSGNFGQVVYNGSIGAITSSPSGSSSNRTSVTNSSYANNSYQRDMTAVWDLNQGNVAGGITALHFYTTLGAFQMSVSPAIPKDLTKVLTMSFRVSWTRV